MTGIGIILSLLMNVSHAQTRNKTYDLYYNDETKNKYYFYPSGLGFRNDTLFIELSSPINVVAIRREKDSAFRVILLKPFRQSFNPIVNHSKIPANVKKDSVKTSKP